MAAPAVDTRAEQAEADFHEDEDVENPDAVDTAPTRIPTAVELSGGRHAAADPDADSAVEPDEHPLEATQLAIHLPLDDPYEVPDGYPVKASASYGLYYAPGDPLYDDTLAEIWFVSEQAAQANGFTKPR